MSIIESSKGKDQLLVNGFRYRRANKSQITWRCVHGNCAGRVTFDNMECIILTDHNHVPNPDGLISIEFKAKVNKRAETSTDAPLKIIHETLLDVHSADGSTITNYNSKLKYRGSSGGAQLLCHPLIYMEKVTTGKGKAGLPSGDHDCSIKNVVQ
jgi:hypothetical protein